MVLNSSIMYKHALQQKTGHARIASRKDERSRKKETISTSVYSLTSSPPFLHPVDERQQKKENEGKCAHVAGEREKSLAIHDVDGIVDEIISFTYP